LAIGVKTGGKWFIDILSSLSPYERHGLKKTKERWGGNMKKGGE